MKAIHVVATVALFAAVFAGIVHASDPTALYARVDKVVFEPSSGPPQTIQVWGVFALAKPDDRTDYLPPARGYLYFKLAGSDELARKEWSDLKQLAGSRQIVSLGSRYQLKVQLRKADQPPQNPDAYVVASGLTRVRSDTSYAPIRALLDYRN